MLQRHLEHAPGHLGDVIYLQSNSLVTVSTSLSSLTVHSSTPLLPVFAVIGHFTESLPHRYYSGEASCDTVAVFSIKGGSQYTDCIAVFVHFIHAVTQ